MLIAQTIAAVVLSAHAAGSAVVVLPTDARFEKLQRPAFSLLYPKGWTVDPEEEFTPGGKYFMEIYAGGPWYQNFGQSLDGMPKADLVIRRTPYGMANIDKMPETMYVKLKDFKEFAGECDCDVNPSHDGFPKGPRYPAPMTNCGHIIWRGELPYGRGVVLKEDWLDWYKNPDDPEWAAAKSDLLYERTLDGFTALYEVSGQTGVYSFELTVTKTDDLKILPLFYAAVASFVPKGAAPNPNYKKDGDRGLDSLLKRGGK